jgi:phosphomannomutase
MQVDGDRDALIGRVREFIRHEVDDGDREELESLLAIHAFDELEGRFSGMPTFGTAGIRGVIGAGESRMNRTLVIRVTYGVVRYLLHTIDDAATRGIAIARDGRHRSDVFQRDAAAVAAALGVRVHWLDGTSPTPVLAFAVRHLGAAAGIVITASHNPPAYNGYKVYWDNGAQIVPPVDAGIAAAIDRAPPADEVSREPNSSKIETVDVQGTYVDAIAALALAPDVDVSEMRVAYSALHGVGQPTFLEVMGRRGFEHVYCVAEQGEPNGDFPTVSFPNPEEPGALDRVLALAAENDCPLVLVNDPDADRLGAAVRDAGGRYVSLTGNEIGVLLTHYVLSTTREEKPLVVSTVVSTRMAAKMCAELGVRYQDTLTGFKWITNEAMRIEREEGCRFVVGFEEALGYAIGAHVRDKDGISAALVLAEMAASLAADGRTLLDELDRLHQRFGRYVNRQTSFTLEGAEGAAKIRAAMNRLKETDRDTLASERVVRRDRDDVLIYDLASGGRVAARPSGTEPKLKLYLEVVGEDAEARLDAIETDMLRTAGLDETGR